MSPRHLLVSALVFVAAVPVVAGLKDSTGAGGLAEVFSTPQPYATPLRLARTPRMDGVFRPEEWDVLWGDVVARPMIAPAIMLPITDPALPPKAGVTLLDTPRVATQTLPQSAPRPGIEKPVAPVRAEPITPLVAPVSQAALMSWEPGKLYFGAILAPGNDMLISIDAGNNGFLIGNDNLELRVTPGSPSLVKARILDATAPAGPAWIDAPGFAMAGTVVSTALPDGSTFVEFSVVDPGYNLLHPEFKSEFGLRVDAIPTVTPPAEAFLPRLVTKVRLIDQRVTNLPTGIEATVGAKGRSVMPGEATSVRWELSGERAAGIKSLEISGEGALADEVNLLRVPSPGGNPKGTATVDYPTRVVPTTPVGYGVLRGELTGATWNAAYVESSFRIAPPIDLVSTSMRVLGSPKAFKVTCKVDIVSNTTERMDGNFQVLPPDGWKVVDGSDKSFVIMDKGSKAKREFVLDAPGGVHGTFKATLRIVTLGGVVDQPFWITVH